MKRDDLINLLVIRNLENPELRNGAINARHPEDLFVQPIERLCFVSLKKSLLFICTKHCI
jgi:hypothetical protein